MRIEDYWLDGIEYHVEFLVKDGRCIRRQIVVPMGTEETEVKQLVGSRFHQVQKVVCIECLADVLCLKG